MIAPRRQPGHDAFPHCSLPSAVVLQPRITVELNFFALTRAYPRTLDSHFLPGKNHVARLLTPVQATRRRICGKTNPPWGHVNIFDEQSSLFPRCSLNKTPFVGSTNDRTNPLSAWLMDIAGNPWGVYEQDEPCIHCGKRISPPDFPAFRAEVDCGRSAQVEPVAVAVQSCTSQLDSYGVPESLGTAALTNVSRASSPVLGGGGLGFGACFPLDATTDFDAIGRNCMAV